MRKALNDAGLLVLLAAVLVASLVLLNPRPSEAGQDAGAVVTLTPSRLLDTRVGTGAPLGPISAGSTTSVPVVGRGGVPNSGVSAVVLNVTVTQPGSTGFLTVWASGTSRPNASSLNFVPGQTVPNLVLAPVGVDGKVSVFNGSTGTAQLIADVSGYVTSGPATAAGALVPTYPTRLLDSLAGIGVPTTADIPALGEVSVQIAGQAGLPATGVTAVLLNVTVDRPTSFGFVTVWGSDTARPPTSNVNFAAGQTVPNLVLAPVGADGRVHLYNGSAGQIRLIADVSGYVLAGGPSSAGTIGTLSPARVLDTRNGIGTESGQAVTIPAQGTVRVHITGGLATSGVPVGEEAAVLLNVTVTSPRTFGYLTVFAGGTTRPATSSLNFTAYQTVPNLTFAPVGSDGSVAIFNGSLGSVAVVADVFGYVRGTPTPSVLKAVALASTGSRPGACAQLNDGSARCWGYNAQGQVGNGTADTAAVPVTVQSLTGVTALSAGQLHTCAVTGGTVRCWGYNAGGAPGNGTLVDGWSPNPVPGVTDATGVASGLNHSCALISGGTVRCWGYNSSGELGDGGATYYTVSGVQVVGLSAATAVAAGSNHTCALLDTGTVTCWGLNADGQLGNGSTTSSKVPDAVPGLSGVTAISAADTDTCALLIDGTVSCWGSNYRGVLSNGSGSYSSTPVAKAGISGATSISADSNHMCAVVAGGAVRCWGDNFNGQLGDGTTDSSAAPVTVIGMDDAVQVVTGYNSSCALRRNGTAVCWGSDQYGQLGDAYGPQVHRGINFEVSPW